MAVKTYGINHVALEVTDIQQAVQFYTDVFALEKRHVDDAHAFFYVGEHQFLALKKVERMPREHDGHFGLIVRDANQLEEVKTKVTQKYGLRLDPEFACDFRDPFGNRVQVADLHDESLIWLLPYRECQKADVVFSDDADQGDGWQ
jgi:catechol 2,3-dioxygenase-like lactoylglutathione lyase family enzyme